MRKILPAFSVLLFVGGVIALLFVPLGELPPSVENTNAWIEQAANADEAMVTYEKWKLEKERSGAEIQQTLRLLETRFSADYRFSLERIRGEENLKGVSNKNEQIQVFATAAKKAILKKETKRILADVKANKKDKKEGFGTVAAYHKSDWPRIERALQQKSLKQLKRYFSQP